MILAGRSFYEIELVYRSRFRKALVASMGLLGTSFLALGLVFPAETTEDPEWLGRDGRLIFRTEISPPDEVEASVQAEARRRSQAGALRLIEIEITEPTDRVQIDPPSSPRPIEIAEHMIPEPLPDPVEGPRVEIGTMVPVQQPEIAVELQLSEDLSTVTTTTPSAETNKFAILEMVLPLYPTVSEWYEIEGLVTIKAMVEPDGSVARVTTLDNEADVFCERAAQQALLAWQFKPIEVERQRVWFSVVVPFQFRLE